MKKVVFFFAAALMAAQSYGFRVFNSQVCNFEKFDRNLYTCEIRLSSGKVVKSAVSEDLKKLIEANRVSLDLQYSKNDRGEMFFFLVPNFNNIPR